MFYYNTVVFLKGKWGLEFSDAEQLLNDNYNTFHLIILQPEFVLTFGLKHTSQSPKVIAPRAS